MTACTGITHEQKIFVVACNIAEDLTKQDEHAKQRVQNSLFMLTLMVKKEDCARAKELIKEHVSKCQCDVCKGVKEMVLEALKTEEEQTPLDNTRADDSFSA